MPEPKKDRRNKSVSVRFKEAEHAALLDRAERTSRGPSSLVRDAALHILNLPLPKTKKTPSGLDRQLAELSGDIRIISANMRRLVDGEADPLDPTPGVGDLAKKVGELKREMMTLIAVVQSPVPEAATKSSAETV